jgi:lysophospholipid acyltransferase (LPLAT)-like uncharacterized protein
MRRSTAKRFWVCAMNDRSEQENERQGKSGAAKTRSRKKRKKWSRTLLRKAAPALIKGVYLTIVHSARSQRLIGADHAEQLLAGGRPFLPCYWHQQSIFCIGYLLELQRRGLNLGFLVSPSADGAIGAKVFESVGARALRGSSTRTGAQALRDIYQAVKQEGLSIATTPDGPRGPAFEFKQGWIMLAQLTGTPLLPLAYACDRAWRFNSWDRFFVPKPFARIVVAVGEPKQVPSRLSAEDMKALQEEMAELLNALAETARAALAQT